MCTRTLQVLLWEGGYGPAPSTAQAIKRLQREPMHRNGWPRETAVVRDRRCFLPSLMTYNCLQYRTIVLNTTIHTVLVSSQQAKGSSCTQESSTHTQVPPPEQDREPHTTEGRKGGIAHSGLVACSPGLFDARGFFSPLVRVSVLASQLAPCTIFRTAHPRRMLTYGIDGEGIVV